jgi:hypothetical protein
MSACTWSGHADAVAEAGWCPVCDEGDLDAEWATRHGVEIDPEEEET